MPYQDIRYLYYKLSYIALTYHRPTQSTIRLNGGW